MTPILGYMSYSSIVFGQNDAYSNTSTEAVTSSYDALVKAVLIISQLAIAGLAFNEILYIYIKHRVIKVSEYKENSSWTSHVQVSNRFLNLIIIFSMVMVVASTTILSIQLLDLEQELGIDITTAFDIIISTSVGGVWITRIVCSIVIILVAIIYYVLAAKMKNKKENSNRLAPINGKKTKLINYMFPSIFLFFIMISLYSNSMISHSNALSSFSELAVFVDWVHLTAVSIWIGGLFYIYSMVIKDWESESKKINDANLPISSDELDQKDQQSTLVNYIMNFSYVAILSLIIIGITGLILGRIHLQTISSLFITVYGNILILKICLTLPMILLGKYNQDKIERISHLLVNSGKNVVKENHRDFENPRNQIFNKFKNSIRIELLVGLAIVIVASFLSVTSPPSLSNSNTSALEPNTNQELINGLSFSDGQVFTTILIILSVVIVISGIANLRKNSGKIKTTKQY